MQQGRRRITVDLGSAELYRALRIAAAQRDSSMREVVVEALEGWLSRQEGATPLVTSEDSNGR
ncbi:MAG: hypothetical protein V3S98_02195 [Dehalococcoidia bacterium]